VTPEHALPTPLPVVHRTCLDLSGPRMAFLAATVRSPGQIGAVAPSSPQLAGLLASVVPAHGTPVVVELGPGTGSVSAAIDARLPEGARHLAVELDPRLAAFLRRTRPGVEVIDGDARELTGLLAERAAAEVDAVVGGLPWSLFGQQAQGEILAQVGAAIGRTGVFTTFAYTHTRVIPAARRFRELLAESFEEVQTSRTVWRNLPPAYAYVCRRPRSAPQGPV